MSPRKHGFSLVELVVVIMILGILAAIAAPNFLGTSRRASDQSLVQTLQVVRNAIDMYYAENGILPAAGASATETQLKTALSAYIKGDFPRSTVGSAPSNTVTIEAPASGEVTGAANGTGWKYNRLTGNFIINNNGATFIDPAKTYDQL